MQVSLGTAAFVLASASAGLSSEGSSRVIQGIVTGIGFIGAGSILRMTAAIGVAVGLSGLAHGHDRQNVPGTYAKGRRLRLN